MKIEFSSIGQSATLKVAAIGFLVLVLLIPISMIDGIIDDRSSVLQHARNDISHSWGGYQKVTGPLLAIPYTVRKTPSGGRERIEERRAYIVAAEFLATAHLQTEIRSRGIHGIPVYSASVDMRGKFDLARLGDKGLPLVSMNWREARLIIGVRDASAVTRTPTMSIGDTTRKFETSTIVVPGLPAQLEVAVGDLLAEGAETTSLGFDIDIGLNGTDTFEILPLAENADVTASSDWPSPSFIGRRLPASHDVRDNGFDANWHATGLGRDVPAVWNSREFTNINEIGGAFGVRLIQPVGLYQLMYRALNYAVLFVGLTFVMFFVTEIVAGARLHPLQYLLVGLANTLFYLLLLSLAEQVGFEAAYLASALGSSALIVGYCVSILASRVQVFAMAVVLAALYAFLYMTLRAESLALLAGSVGLWVILAAVMFMTRRVNWYALGRRNDDPE